MQKWEYTVWRVENLGPSEVESGLNALGRDGWELVAIQSPSLGSGGNQWVLFALELYLKRPIA